MIAHLTGRILRKGPQEVVIETAGVGYRVTIPLSTFYKLANENTDASLRIYTHVREDTLQLYGFLTAAEQELFEKLIAVSGVGPRLATSILSGIETADLTTALRESDVARLTRIPGVGKKTAERLVVELKDKMPATATLGDEPRPATGTPKHDVVSALANLGYSRPEAERAVDKALREDASGRFEDLLRRSLRILSGVAHG